VFFFFTKTIRYYVKTNQTMTLVTHNIYLLFDNFYQKKEKKIEVRGIDLFAIFAFFFVTKLFLHISNIYIMTY
jgi:hypothetical protein